MKTCRKRCKLDFAFNCITNNFHILFEGKHSNIEVSLDVYIIKKNVTFG